MYRCPIQKHSMFLPITLCPWLPEQKCRGPRGGERDTIQYLWRYFKEQFLITLIS